MERKASEISFRVPGDCSGERLDACLARLHPDLSRARWQKLIRSGLVTVDGRIHRPHAVLKGGEMIRAVIPPPEEPGLVPRPLPLEVLYQDDVLLAVNKPPGLVVHPAPGHRDDTLVNALLHHYPELAGVGGPDRPGIVHRLDKDTSGVMLVARTEAARLHLQRQFKARSVTKRYLALVRGVPDPPEGTVAAPIGRSPSDRKKMSIYAPRSRPAETHYRVLATGKGVALLEVFLLTGRTHQIRVHLAHRGHPVLGDRQYGRGRTPEGVVVPRQMLHAESIAFTHPHGQSLKICAPLPTDMRKVLEQLDCRFDMAPGFRSG